MHPPNSSSISGQSLKPRSGSGPPLISRFSSSLLWYVGLGGALRQRHRFSMQQQQQQAQPASNRPPSAAAAAAIGKASAGAAPSTARSGNSTPAAAVSGGLPMSQPGIQERVTTGPTSHSLTLQQIEQSLEFSTSSSSGVAGAVPVQAATKGKPCAGKTTYRCTMSVLCTEKHPPLHIYRISWYSFSTGRSEKKAS